MALNRVYGEGFTEKVNLGGRCKGGKRSKPCSSLGAGISGKEYKFKGPEAGAFLVR